jgi:hypothetical protein
MEWSRWVKDGIGGAIVETSSLSGGCPPMPSLVKLVQGSGNDSEFMEGTLHSIAFVCSSCAVDGTTERCRL